jgi:ferric iron reductase protein FhuF
MRSFWIGWFLTLLVIGVGLALMSEHKEAQDKQEAFKSHLAQVELENQFQAAINAAKDKKLCAEIHQLDPSLRNGGCKK